MLHVAILSEDCQGCSSALGAKAGLTENILRSGMNAVGGQSKGVQDDDVKAGGFGLASQDRQINDGNWVQ